MSPAKQTNFIKQSFAAKLGIWLINNTNKNGPGTDSWWTPDEMSTKDGSFQLQSTACWRWWKYYLNHSNSTFLIPYKECFLNNESWWIVLKHLTLSNVQIPVIWLSFTFWSQASITLCRLIWVEWPFKYSSWLGVMKNIHISIPQVCYISTAPLFSQCSQWET